MSNHFRFTLWTCRIMLEIWSRKKLSSVIQSGNAGQGLCFAIVQWHRLPFCYELEICYLPKRFSVLPLSGHIIACFGLVVNLFFTEIYIFLQKNCYTSIMSTFDRPRYKLSILIHLVTIHLQAVWLAGTVVFAQG